MQKIHWDDYRVAYQVAQAGSLTRAAKKLQCNHATVLRHVNRLEAALNIKLFIRHQRGYKLTDAGHILVHEMPDIYADFNRLENALGSVEQDISGNLRITTLAEFSSLLNPALLQFRKFYPKLRIQIISTDDVMPLASGIVHVSLRAGPEPQDPDLIVRKIMHIELGYYAAGSYVEKHGLPKKVDEYNQHDWVMPSIEKQRIPMVKNVLQYIDVERVVYQSNHYLDVQSAVIAGMGIGMMSALDAANHENLQHLSIKNDEKDTGILWYVYHRDLKHNAKVKALYKFLTESL